jgi:amino acid transporter
MATVMMVTGGVLVLWVSLMYTAPVSNWPEAFLIAFFPNLAMASLFTIVGISLPRSGGDYVFTSRGLNSFLGFVNYWGIAWAFIINVGIFSYYTGTYFGYLLTGLGAYYNDSNLLSLGTYITQSTPSFILAIVVVLVATLMVGVVKPRISWGIIFWGGVLALICTGIMYAALLQINASTFATDYNSFMGNATAYNAVLQSGGVTPPSDPWLATAAALPFVWFSYTWYNLPTSWSGEMKTVRRSMPIAIIFGLAATMIYYVFMAFIVGNAFGQPFLENWGSLTTAGSSPISGIGGFIPFFGLLAFHSVPLYFVMFLALWLPAFLELPAVIIGQTRYMFAWAFDRVLPDKMASVSEKFHTPLYSTLAVMVGAIVASAFMAYSPKASEFATLSFTMFSFGFIIPAIAGIVLPYRRKQLYETAFVAKKTYLLPILSWLGLGSCVYLIYSVYLSTHTGALPIDSFSMTMYGTIYLTGMLIFVAAYIRNQRRGLSLDLVFKEIPPE